MESLSKLKRNKFNWLKDKAILGKLSRLTAFGSIVFLLLTAIAIAVNDKPNAEDFAIYAYYLLTLTVLFDSLTGFLKRF